MIKVTINDKENIVMNKIELLTSPHQINSQYLLRMHYVVDPSILEDLVLEFLQKNQIEYYGKILSTSEITIQNKSIYIYCNEDERKEDYKLNTIVVHNNIDETTFFENIHLIYDKCYKIKVVLSRYESIDETTVDKVLQYLNLPETVTVNRTYVLENNILLIG